MSLETRVIELETRSAFQEQALAELGDLVHRQYRELEALRRLLEGVQVELLALRDAQAPGAAAEPPPPHY